MCLSWSDVSDLGKSGSVLFGAQLFKASLA